MMYLDTPIEIAINEAVEITKLYDDQKAVSFINGVLGGIAKTL
jgi:N utilization substance protein B